MANMMQMDTGSGKTHMYLLSTYDLNRFGD